MTKSLRLAVTVAAYLAGLTLVALMLGTVADVAGRYFFNSPITGVFDLTHFAVVIMVYLGLGYCTYYGAHAAIDIIFDRLPAVARDILQRLADLAGAVLLCVIAWQTGKAGIQVRDFNQSSQLLELPVYPLYWVVVFGCLLFALVLIAHALQPDLKQGQSRE
ncbi:MAG: TRAP transporter small permease [Hyphomicrobiaceae bacterium]